MSRYARLLPAILLAGVALGLAGSASGYAVGDGYAVQAERYIIALNGDYAVSEGYAVGSSYAVYAVAHDYAVYAVQAAGGTVTNDLSRQIGVLVAESSNANFATLVQQYAVINGYAVIQSVSKDKATKQKKHPPPTTPPPADPLEAQQWGMSMIRADKAHARTLGSRAVDVGILDSGIDPTHVDFSNTGLPGGPSNVDCSRGHLSVPESPVGGASNACSGDSGAHGTHVAGIVAAQLNGTGVVGVAPNVTLVPVQVCDGLVCWWSAAVDGITYAGDAKLDVINMSFYADDVETTSALKDCDSEDSATVAAVNRAIAYARSRGVTPVAALGNSAENLAAPEFDGCKVVPAESPGVIGVTALGPTGALASYSNYGYGSADVAAPGGDGPETDSSQAILSTIPGYWASLNGTSMASPHAAGVAALIESRYGKSGAGGDVEMKPDQVQAKLQGTATDIGVKGYDQYFGYGRIDALRAIGG
jgi:lantibiotic leader peptide-processing serine protease